MSEEPAIAPALHDLVAPDHTALLTVEVQEGVVGDRSLIPALAQAADPILPRIGALVRGARAAGVVVVHCTADSRPDGLGSNHNARLFAAMRARPGGEGRAAAGSGTARVHELVGVSDRDLVFSRLHGLSPLTGTSVDPVLRNLDVTTIVATGVSVNVALMGLAFEAVNLGYQLVIPRDAVAGVDAAYVDSVFEHTFSLLATVTTTAELVQIWGA